MRARDQITELRAAELRFTTEEATTFLKDVMGLTLSAGDVASLEEVTEGWVAALQLAALSMRDREDASGFVEAFSGSNRHVLDFLAEEVLERQPEEVRQFLLKTSVLESMSAPLCDALTGHSDGQAMLERLERENLFVVALDDERWYRYHHLFADFLRGRLLTGESPELVAGELHLRASGWYEAQGLEVEAIGHALLASEADPHHEVASRLIERGVRGAWSRGEGPTVLGWLEALPEEAKRRRPRLLLQHAQALVLTGRPDEAEPLLREAERAASEASTEKSSRFLMGFASAVRSWRARLRGDASEAVELARRALSLLPDEEAYLRNFAAVCLGDALWITGDLAAAGAAFAEAAEIGRAAGHIYGTLNAMALRARVQAERGRLREAEEAFREVLRFVIEQGIGQLPAAGLVHIGMADITYERDDIDAAERELEMGIGLTERTREVGELVRGYVTLSKVKRARGTRRAPSRRPARPSESRAPPARTCRSPSPRPGRRGYIARGDLEETAALEQERATNAASGASQAVDRLTSARLLHARGRHDEALRLLGELREAAEAAGRTGTVIEILSLQALALWASNEKEQGVGTLTQALAMAEPEGYVRTFVDEGPAMSELLSEVLQARQRGHLDAAGRVSTQYLAKLLAALDQASAAPASTNSPSL